MKRVAIVQSNYVPWKGYFDLIRSVDEFILYDDVQYTRRDWRNRNLIKTTSGPAWLTIPVESKGLYLQRIDETRVGDATWPRRHWSSLVHAYARAPQFAAFAADLETCYRALEDEPMLSRINRTLIDAICRILAIDTTITSTAIYPASGDATERLVGICRQAGATHYLSGPAARSYLRPELFDRADIMLEYADYSGYPEYPQMYGAFTHQVSVLDLIFNAGPDARNYLKTLV